MLCDFKGTTNICFRYIQYRYWQRPAIGGSKNVRPQVNREYEGMVVEMERFKMDPVLRVQAHKFKIFYCLPQRRLLSANFSNIRKQCASCVRVMVSGKQLGIKLSKLTSV